ncbi:probable cytochrome P450 309a1 [Bactrocera dorsalis]|uniref:Probable cytochrome P450 309a1 n=1 Tax=Bactrocera dorsalis TaxID=27457 RepID=A0A8N4L0K9_BACDO|nr:probable cytochrome P450 309a1 [Bactrocera dorsalis]
MVLKKLKKVTAPSFEMVPLLVTFVLLATVGFLIHKYLTWHYDTFKKLGIVGPAPKIWHGNFTGKQQIAYDYDDIYNKYRQKHQIVGMFAYRQPQFLIIDPKLAHEVLVTNFKSFRNNLGKRFLYDKEADPVAALNPFFNVGEEWKTIRSDIMSGLTHHKLSSAYTIWKTCTEKLGKLLSAQTAKGSSIIETKDLVLRYTFNIMGEFLWGIETKTLESLDEPNHYLEVSHRLIHQVFHGFMSYYKCLPFPWCRRFANYRIFTAESDHMFSQFTKDAYVLRERDASKTNQADFLHYVRQLQEKKSLSHYEVVGYLLAVFTDGFDTSGTVAFHTLFYLTHHPECQEKLRKEILNNLEADGNMNYETLNVLPYLDQCVHETLRMISPITFKSRLCTESTEIVLDDGRRIPIKKGQVVTIPVFSYLHDPEYFEDPLEFRPERFENVDISELTKRGIFLPFSDGPRMCLGRHLGFLQIKTAIVEVLKNYRLKVCDKTPPIAKLDSHALINGVDGDLFIEYERL